VPTPAPKILSTSDFFFGGGGGREKCTPVKHILDHTEVKQGFSSSSKVFMTVESLILPQISSTRFVLLFVQMERGFVSLL